MGVLSRLKYLFELVRMNAARKPPTAQGIVSDINKASDTYESYSGKSASEAKFLEIGFGADPIEPLRFRLVSRMLRLST